MLLDAVSIPDEKLSGSVLAILLNTNSYDEFVGTKKELIERIKERKIPTLFAKTVLARNIKVGSSVIYKKKGEYAPGVVKKIDYEFDSLILRKSDKYSYLPSYIYVHEVMQVING